MASVVDGKGKVWRVWLVLPVGASGWCFQLVFPVDVDS